VSAGIPQDFALRLQLAAICGNELETSFIEIRPYDRAAGKWCNGRAWVPVRDLEVAAARCLVLAERRDVYIGCAPRIRRGGCNEDVERVWCLWADCDGADPLAHLARFRPLPSIVVRSGSPDHAHAYWPLKRSVPPAWAQRANHRLKLALASDNVTDPARVLRAAGTLNHKHEPPAAVVCTRLEFDGFELSEVIAGCVDEQRYLRRPARQPVARSGAPANLAGLVQTVRTAQLGNCNNTLHWAACRLAEHVATGEADEQEGRELLHAAALDAGIPERDIDKTITSGLMTAA
jgi:hypothetical protein